MAPKHIAKRYKTWYAVLDIPAAVRGHFGGLRKFTKTLDTHSEAQALVRAPFLIAKWKAKIAHAKGTTMDPLEQDVQWVKKLQAAEIEASASAENDYDMAGAEADDVLKRVAALDKSEWEADHLQATLSQTLFSLEDELKATDIFLWFKIFGELGQLANSAEKTGDRLRRMLAS